MSIKIDDDINEDVAAIVYQWNGDGFRADRVCGSTDEPIPLLRGATGGEVDLAVGPCTDGTPTTATLGTVAVSYSNHH